jgi:hypothetical protein
MFSSVQGAPNKEQVSRSETSYLGASPGRQGEPRPRHVRGLRLAIKLERRIVLATRTVLGPHSLDGSGCPADRRLLIHPEVPHDRYTQATLGLLQIQGRARGRQVDPDRRRARQGIPGPSRPPRSAEGPASRRRRVARSRRKGTVAGRCRYALQSDRPRHPPVLAVPRSRATASMSLYFCHRRAVNGYGEIIDDPRASSS